MFKHGRIYWHEWRGSSDGRPVMLIRTIAASRGYRIDLHKFLDGDEPTCFHTHPATAIRIILWGGYIEEIRKDDSKLELKPWFPTGIGIVKPELCHRIHSLLNGKYSYSLWIRFPKRADVKIFGEC